MLDYKFDWVAELQRGGRPVQRLSMRKLLKFTARDDRYLLVYDSVLKTSEVPGSGPRLAPYMPEDTLSFYVSLGRHGELPRIELGCDPAVRECGEALPSVVQQELRRLIPRLPLWEAPRGSVWVDTLAFDDAARPRGTRGMVVTQYGPARDTVIGGRGYWMIGWHSVRTGFRRVPGPSIIAPEQPVEEDGVTLVDKARLIPIFSTWAGALAAPPDLAAQGIESTGFRGRAYLTGSVFDSAFAFEERALPRGPESAGRRW